MKRKLHLLLSKDKRLCFTIFFLIQVTLLIMIILNWVGSKCKIVDGYYATHSLNNMLLVAVFLSGLLGVVALYMLREFVVLMEKEKELDMQKVILKQMGESNDLLHAQKHDFLNHIQVIAGMLYLGKMERAQEYLKGISEGMVFDKKDIEVLEELEYPHLYTLFLNKIHKCKEMGIEIHYDIEKTEYLNDYHSIDLVRILGNLLDNAIYEVKSLKKELRKINISIFEDREEVIFEVYNIQPIISKEIQNKIFDKGFTTKEDKGTGMGLYNVKNVVGKYGGSVEVISEQGFGTSFIVKLPIVKKQYAEGQ
ncbi:GHKL domain-containing protein [Clostridiaceae bacterium 35-E11]